MTPSGTWMRKMTEGLEPELESTKARDERQSWLRSRFGFPLHDQMYCLLNSAYVRPSGLISHRR